MSRDCDRLAFPADGAGVDVLRAAALVLAGGGLLAYPTDTLYALGGTALSPEAARRVRDAKGREDDKPLPVVAADVAQAAALCSSWPELAERLARAFWPGPLTLVLPARSGLPKELTSGGPGIAVRVPAHASLRRLCARSGPLVSTSANRSGQRAPRSLDEALGQVGAGVGLALDGGPATVLVPSTLVDLSTGATRCLREGSLSWARIQAASKSGS